MFSHRSRMALSQSICTSLRKVKVTTLTSEDSPELHDLLFELSVKCQYLEELEVDAPNESALYILLARNPNLRHVSLTGSSGLLCNVLRLSTSLSKVHILSPIDYIPCNYFPPTLRRVSLPHSTVLHPALYTLLCASTFLCELRLGVITEENFAAFSGVLPNLVVFRWGAGTLRDSFVPIIARTIPNLQTIIMLLMFPLNNVGLGVLLSHSWLMAFLTAFPQLRQLVTEPDGESRLRAHPLPATAAPYHNTSVLEELYVPLGSSNLQLELVFARCPALKCVGFDCLDPVRSHLQACVAAHITRLVVTQHCLPLSELVLIKGLEELVLHRTKDETVNTKVFRALAARNPKLQVLTLGMVCGFKNYAGMYEVMTVLFEYFPCLHTIALNFEAENEVSSLIDNIMFQRLVRKKYPHVKRLTSTVG